MKFQYFTGLALAACACATSVQAEMKIASVNMQDLYKSYYKRIDAEKRLNELKTLVEGEIREREENLKQILTELKAIQDKHDPALPQAAQERLKAEYTAKMNQAQAAEQEYKQFQQRRQRAFQESQRREILILLADIQKVVDEAAGAAGYDLVIDTGATTPMNTRIFPFAKKSLDITPEMMKKLNEGAPEGYDAKAELEKANNPAAVPAAQ